MYTKQTQVTFSFPSEDGRIRKSKVAHLPTPLSRWPRTKRCQGASFDADHVAVRTPFTHRGLAFTPRPVR